MRVLITGASGLLGKSLIETNKAHGLYLTYHKNYTCNEAGQIWYSLDVRQVADVNELFELVRPQVVIHCAAQGSVDYAERAYDEVLETNYMGTKHVVDAANLYKAKIAYISTNAVYDGNNPPYNEDSPQLPVNAYGIIKRRAEEYVRQVASSWLIIRPFLLYGWPYPGGRQNWANTIVNKLRQGERVKLVDDHIWMPTYAPDCAWAIWGLLEYNNTSFNVATSDRVTLYQFGLKVCEVFSLDQKLLEPVSSDYFGSMAKRPRDTTYDLSRLNKVGFLLNDIKTGLEEMKADEIYR